MRLQNAYRSKLVLLCILFSALGLVVSACQAPTAELPNPITSGAPVTSPTANPTSEPAPVNTPAPRPSTAANENICPGSASLPGLDVSDYDADTQWPTVAETGRKFAYVKATQGNDFTNPYFASDWASIKAQGMVRGAYHYFIPNEDPLDQANYFLAQIGTLSSTDLPPVLDWEETGGLSSSEQIQAALVWLAQVKSVTGKTPMIYVDPSFWNALGNPVEFAAYPLYIANYEVSCPAIPAPWSSWTFWQQGSGPVEGVDAADVDLDVFNGTSAQLQSFAASGVL